MSEPNDNLLLLVGRIDGKLDTLLARHDHLEKRLDAQAKRIEALEGFKGRAALLGSVLVAALSAGMTVFTTYLSNLLTR